MANQMLAKLLAKEQGWTIEQASKYIDKCVELMDLEKAQERDDLEADVHRDAMKDAFGPEGQG